MIAAISPADINYEETLSTLRYADRAKQIKTKAVINDKSQDRVIRELMEENERLKKQLMEILKVPPTTLKSELSPEERASMQEEMRREIQAQLQANSERLETQNQKAFLEKLAEARREAAILKEVLGNAKSEKDSRSCIDCPYISNLNEDPQLSGVINHLIEADEVTVGRQGAPGNPETEEDAIDKLSGKRTWVLLKGLNIHDIHAKFRRLSSGQIELAVVEGSLKNTKVNGTALTSSKILEPADRILFGSYHLYVFHNPKQTALVNEKKVDWESAQQELARGEGMDQFGQAMMEKDRFILQQQLIEMMPMVREVNAIASRLNKHRTFEILLLPPLIQQALYGQGKTTKIMIRMTCNVSGHVWIWERGKFMNRRFLIQEMFQEFENEDHASTRKKSITQEDDPFWEPLESLLVGFVPVFLQSLAYGLDFSDRLQITDLDGAAIGWLDTALKPCFQSGSLSAGDDDFFVDDPKDLLGKPYYFKVELKELSVTGLKSPLRPTLHYRVFKERSETIIPIQITDQEVVSINHSRLVTFKRMEAEHVEYLEEGCITFLMFVEQSGSTSATAVETSSVEVEHPNLRRGSIAVLQGVDEQVKQNILQKLQQIREKQQRARFQELKEMLLHWRNLQPSAEAFEEVINGLNALFDPKLPCTSNCDKSSLGAHAEVKTSILQKNEENAATEENASKKKKKQWSLNISKVPNTTPLNLRD
uniref:Kinesin-like protein KIF28P n=1 Tax=Schistocephalus solidus TaxID=70667 RepID=A0A0X3NW88_SCHSO